MTSYQFLVCNFQYIMDLASDEIYTDLEAKQRDKDELSQEYIRIGKLKNTTKDQAWKLIEKRYYKYFDYLLFDVIEN